jgi:cytochrome c553
LDIYFSKGVYLSHATMTEDTAMHRYRNLACLVGILVTTTPLLLPGGGRADEPAVTPEQLQVDWLRQLELRYSRDASAAGDVSVTEDAVGAVDGVKDGKWGFHTANEAQPWWRVDLQQVVPIDRIVLFNRCDGGFASRAGRIIVSLSEDGRTFVEAYQHDGTTFLGFGAGKPLSVDLRGQRARFVRLQLPGTSYFHLDEVEIYAVDSGVNVALHKPATQSSTSQWSSRGAPAVLAAGEAVVRVVRQGLRLAEDLRLRGVTVQATVDELTQIAAARDALAGSGGRADKQADYQQLYLRAQAAIRRLTFTNPLLDFDTILFVKRAPGMFPHVSDQYYGWWSRPGGGICLLQGLRSAGATVRCLTSDWPAGNFLRPDISYDGNKVLFAYCRHYSHLADVADKTSKSSLPEDAFYHIFEMNVDGTGVRQLTRGRYDDFDARYLPNGRIVFLSTRKGTALQAGKYSATATVDATCPDSYVRCGGGNHRPVAVFTLHTMDSDGGDLCAISAFENFEWTPAVAGDGRILYARWDYIDRFNGHFMSLWSTDPDGTNTQLVYGNYTTQPQCIFEARPVPCSNKLVFTATAHHSITGGSLALLDRSRGSEFDRPITRLTPEVCFPETEGWPESYYAHPWPLAEQYHLVSWSDRKLPAHRLMAPDDPNNPTNACGLYLYDTFGNLTLLHRDPTISSVTPIPVVPRPRPPASPSMVDWTTAKQGAFLIQDVYEGLQGVELGQVAGLRIVGVPPKVQPQMNAPSLGVSREDPGKFILGTVPVEADGSAHFQVPSGIPLFFQALDGDGLAIQTMRSLTYVQPGETLACVGCHEHRDTAPPPAAVPLAALRSPSPLEPAPSGSWPLRFDRLVGPVLDTQCVSCHRPDGQDAQAAAFDLTPSSAYQSLMEFADGQLHKLAFERDQSVVFDMPARQSRLYRMLTGTEEHYGVRLSADQRLRLATWMDTYAQRSGSFSEDQERELQTLRKRYAHLLNE